MKTVKADIPLYRTINAFIRQGENYYVAECVEIGVVTQGKTIDETVVNLKEAVALHLEGENLAQLGLAPNPSLRITIELEPVLSGVQAKKTFWTRGHKDSKPVRV